MKKMILLFFIAVAFAAADKLDRTYLPPPGSKFAGGSPGAIDVPLEFPKHTYSTNLRPQEPIPDGSIDSPETYNIGTANNEEQRTSSLAPSVISPAPAITGVLQRNPQRLNIPTTTTPFATTSPSSYGRNVYPNAAYSPQRLNKNQDYRQHNYNPNTLKQNLPNSNQPVSYESRPTPIIPSQESDSETPFNSQLNNQSRNNQAFNLRQPGLTSSSLNNIEQKSKNFLRPSDDQDQLAYPQNQYSMTQVVPSAYDHSEINYSTQTPQFPSEKFSDDLNNELPRDQNKEAFFPSSELMTTGSLSPKNFKEPTASMNLQNNMITKSNELGSTPSPNYQRLPIGVVSHPERPQAVSDRNAFILNYDNVISPEGFAFSFDTSNGIHADESGSTIDGVKAIGSYSYTGDDGKVYTVSYTADENGFQPQGDHLPTAPPIPKEILKAIEQNKKDEEAGIYDDGTYDETKYGYKNYEGAMDRHYPQVPDNSFGNVEDISSQNQDQLYLNRKKPLNYSINKSVPVSRISDIGNNDDYDLIESTGDYKTQGDITAPSQITPQKIPDEVLQQNNGEIIRKISNSGTGGFIRDRPVPPKGINNLASVKSDLNDESENKNKPLKESDSLENLRQMYKPGKKTDTVNYNIETDFKNTRPKISDSQYDFKNEFLKNRRLKPDSSVFVEQPSEIDITTNKPVRNNVQQTTHSQAKTPSSFRQGYESTEASTTHTPSTDHGSSKLYIPPVNQFTQFGTKRKPITVDSKGSYSTRRPIPINIDNKGAKFDIPYSSDSNFRRPIYSTTLKPTTYFDNTLANEAGGTVPATEMNTPITSNYREKAIAKPELNRSKEYENISQKSGNRVFNTQAPSHTFLPSTTLTPSTFESNQTPMYSNNQQYRNKSPLPKVYSKPIIRPTSSYLDRTMAPEIDSTSSTEVSETPVRFGTTVSTSDFIPTSTYRPSYQFQDQTVQGYPVTYDEYGRPTVEPNQSSQLTENQGTTYPGHIYSTPEEDTSSDVFGNTDSYFSRDQGGTSTTPSHTGTKSTVKIIGEDFNGPKQPQKYDADTGYYYK